MKTERECLQISTELHMLQEWYKRNCDGTWENFHGIDIKTLDNPGWAVSIDTNEAQPSISTEQRYIEDLGSDNWIHCIAKDGVFTGNGDPLKLERIINVFFQWTE